MGKRERGKRIQLCYENANAKKKMNGNESSMDVFHDTRHHQQSLQYSFLYQ